MSKKSIEEFKQIWKEEFKENISYDKASDEATNLLNLFKIIYKPTLKKLKTKK